MINMLFHFLFYVLYLAWKVTVIINNKVKLKFQLDRNLKYTFLNNYKGTKEHQNRQTMEIILNFSTLPIKHPKKRNTLIIHSFREQEGGRT